jgi:hypothetical protein
MLTFLSGLAATIGPLALAGGPAGIVIAWLGSLVANKTVKVVAIVVGAGLVIATTVGVTVHIEHLEQDRAALKVARQDIADRQAAKTALERKYGCLARPPEERDLAVCLTARERDAEAAKAAEIDRERKAAAKAQAQLDKDNAAADAASTAEQALIEATPAAADGPVPQVLLDSWSRKRKERGLK